MSDSLALLSEKRQAKRKQYKATGRKQCYSQLCENSLMHIGKRIKALMTARNVTTKQMADYCEVTTGAVSNWFASGRISKENLIKVAAKLQTTSDRLVLDPDGSLDGRGKGLLEASSSSRARDLEAEIAEDKAQVRAEIENAKPTWDAIEVARLFDSLTDPKIRASAKAYMLALAAKSPRATASLAPAPKVVPPPATRQTRSAQSPTAKPVSSKKR